MEIRTTVRNFGYIRVSQTIKSPKSLFGKGKRQTLYHTKILGKLTWDIDVANRQVNHVYRAYA